MHTFSAVHKYLDSGTIKVILALYFSTLDLKLKNEYEVKVQTVTFNLRKFTSISGDRVGIISLSMHSAPILGDQN